MIKLPGLIDPHVHLRTPGQEQKEDFISGTSAAIAGGFTTLLDMPNNSAPITTYDRLKEKQTIAKQQILCDIGFYFGSLGENFGEFPKVQENVFGIKIYMNQTTGEFIVDTDVFKKICASWPIGLPILLHAEENVINEVIETAHAANQKIHICHVSSQSELQIVLNSKMKGYDITCGVTPHHLFLTQEATQRLGGIATMKPALKTQNDIDFLWSHMKDIDVVESDHAPHTLAEKQNANPPFGVPGLETTLALLLTAAQNNKLTLDEITRLCHTNPAKIFSIAVDQATYIEVDETKSWIVEGSKLFTKAKQSPWEGQTLIGKVERVFIRGTKVFENGTILANKGFGRVLKPI